MAAKAQVLHRARLILFGPRPIVVYFLAAGLLLSVALLALFYLLLVVTHPPAAYGQPGAPTSIPSWFAAYASWSSARLAYTEDYGLSRVSTLGFVLSFAIFIAPRLALRTSFVLLNVYFAWTSSLLADVSKPLAAAVTQVMWTQDQFLWATLSLRYITGSVYVVADMEALAMLVVVVALTLLLNLEKGKRRALLLSLQVAALLLAVLGSEIAIFDYREFYLHVTQVQVALDLLPWFSNADLLVSAVAIFATTSSLLRLRRLRPQSG